MTNNKSSALIDIKAGLVVFLIALPLSLGISLASGAPSTAGLISAILGGLIGAYLGGSYVTINGPAAGLIVVVLTSIQNLAPSDPVLGFKRMLGCVVIVGLLQVLSGLLKLGRFASFFPLSVVHGMLSAIGLIIMIKQFHVFFGHRPQGSILSSVAQMHSSLTNLNPEASLIGLASILLLLVYPYLKFKFTKVIPAPLVVVCLGIFMAIHLSAVEFVKVPEQISSFFFTPSFDVIWTKESFFSIFSLFFVASLESVLSASAVDKLDPAQRESDFNRELWSKGIVNTACGFIGGLPIIAEIVRSSAAISQGARTPLANFSHSLFILFFILLFPNILNMIPLPALAAILLLVGFRLSQPKQLFQMRKLGLSSFLAFISTIIFTLVDDLLVGILAGIVVKIIISFIQGARVSSFFGPTYKLVNNGDMALLNFEGALHFFSALKQKEIFSHLQSYSVIEINLSKLKYIDASSLSLISKESDRLMRNGRQVTINLPERYKPLFHLIQKH